MKTKRFYSGNVAYTTPSGRMHMGHGLGQVTTDIAVRFSALQQEKEPFFPFGMHSTGKDIVKIIRQLDNNDRTEEISKRYNISLSEREAILSEPNADSKVDKLVQIYKKQYEEVLKKLGTCIDFETFFSSHQKENHAFTQWTLRKLEESGLIVQTKAQRPYCPDCDDVKAIEKDLSEVIAKGKINWDNLRIENGIINGGDFYCRLHTDTKIVVAERNERAINYGNREFQDRTIKLADKLTVHPEKHKIDIAEIIRTRRAKPFERQSIDMVGSQSPFDKSKKVEALADSNIYMEFFPVAKMINQGKIKLENLNDQLFDFIYLGESNADDVARVSNLPVETVKELETLVNEVCPYDLSVIGFEHKEVHLPFSLFTHAAVLPSRFFFDEYLITAHITNQGEKMSKSKGNVVFLDDIVKTIENNGKIEGLSDFASLDSLRFFLSYYQSLDKDFDWNDDTFKSVGINGTRRFVKGIFEAHSSLAKAKKTDNLSQSDKWLSTLNQRSIFDYTNAMERRNHRDAMINVVDFMGKSLRDYLSKNSNVNKKLVEEVISSQLILASPVMPRIAKELYDNIFGHSIKNLPKYEPVKTFPEEFDKEQHLRLGNEYLQSHKRNIAAQMGKLRGKRLISQGQELYLRSPSQYTADLISSSTIPILQGFRLKYNVDHSLREVFVSPEKNEN